MNCCFPAPLHPGGGGKVSPAAEEDFFTASSEHAPMEPFLPPTSLSPGGWEWAAPPRAARQAPPRPAPQAPPRPAPGPPPLAVPPAPPRAFPPAPKSSETLLPAAELLLVGDSDSPLPLPPAVPPLPVLAPPPPVHTPPASATASPQLTPEPGAEDTADPESCPPPSPTEAEKPAVPPLPAAAVAAAPAPSTISPPSFSGCPGAVPAEGAATGEEGVTAPSEEPEWPDSWGRGQHLPAFKISILGWLGGVWSVAAPWRLPSLPPLACPSSEGQNRSLEKSEILCLERQIPMSVQEIWVEQCLTPSLLRTPLSQWRHFQE
ncbi:uncharacterized protein LOC141728529 [Zonotrichia albicollis]|uniref:uncharacterized protein LOC141728529 n=1 Tax=Zonotrichia albicollis TaxID=44394 RepID=UPI003D80B255